MELVNTCTVSFTLHVVHAQLTPLRVTIMLPSLTSGSSSSLHPAHVQGSSAGGSRLNSSRRRSRRRIMYALSPLKIIMQCPPVVECDDSQQPLALQPVFSEEDLASISSLTSKKARRARRLAITRRLLQDQVKADAAMALELSNSWNPAPRQRHSVARYSPPQQPSPPESPAWGSDDEELVATPTAAVLVTQHTQLRRATGEVQTVRIGHVGDTNYAEVHFWTQDSELDLTALAGQQAWKTQLQFNGRHSAFVTDKYLHSAVVNDSVAHMAGTYFNHGHCSPQNPGGSLRGLMAIDSQLQTAADRRFTSDIQDLMRAKSLRIEGLDNLNFLVGRAYCSDQASDGMCEHRDGSESAVAYSKHAPIIIVSTGEASARLGVRLTPNCSVNSGPEAILDFKAAAHSVHICCFAGPGAQCVRHKVTVPRGVQRFAYVLRCLQQDFRGLKSAQSGESYQQLIHQCEQASLPIWDLLTAAVKSGTVHAASEAIRSLRSPVPSVGAYKQPTGASAWCLDLVGNTPYFGDGSPGSEFSSQPQVLSRIGMHVTPPGQALGLALVAGTPVDEKPVWHTVLASCVVDLTSIVQDVDIDFQDTFAVTSARSYADEVFLQQRQPDEIIMHVPSGPTQRRFIGSVMEAMQLRSPVRVLVKHCPRSCLLPFINVRVLRCAKVIAEPKHLLMHYLGLAYVSGVNSTTFTLKVQSSAAEAWQ
jgi:hypothetical protein